MGWTSKKPIPHLNLDSRGEEDDPKVLAYLRETERQLDTVRRLMRSNPFLEMNEINRLAEEEMQGGQKELFSEELRT